METETVVTDVVETVATNLTLNKTIVIASVAALAGAGAAVAVGKLRKVVTAKLAARAEAEETA